MKTSIPSPKFRIILLQTSEEARRRLETALGAPGSPAPGVDFLWCRTKREALKALEDGHTQWLVSGTINGGLREVDQFFIEAKRCNPRLITALWSSFPDAYVPNADHIIPQVTDQPYAAFLFGVFRVWLEETQTADNPETPPSDRQAA